MFYKTGIQQFLLKISFTGIFLFILDEEKQIFRLVKTISQYLFFSAQSALWIAES
jgi:cytochrome bd-type quinol oxidase subunit 1